MPYKIKETKKGLMRSSYQVYIIKLTQIASLYDGCLFDIITMFDPDMLIFDVGIYFYSSLIFIWDVFMVTF